MKHWLYPQEQMVHQQSKIFYRSGAGKLRRCQWWNTDYTLGNNGSPAEQDILQKWSRKTKKDVNDETLIIPSRINGSPAEQDILQEWSRKTKKMSVMKHWLYPRVQMVHQLNKIFYRSGAGKLKRCHWWNTDYIREEKWFTSRVRYSTGVEQEN